MMTKEELLKSYPLLTDKYFTLLTKSIVDLIGKDDLTDDRGYLTDFIDRCSDEDGDDFYYDMLRCLKYIMDEKSVAYTTPDKQICLHYPSTDMVPQDNLRFQRWYFIYCHECLHQLWDTFGVEEEIRKKYGSCDHNLLNIASDCVINDFLDTIDTSHKKRPVDGIFPEVIEKDFGIKYDRKVDTQFTLYEKLKPISDKIKEKYKEELEKNAEQHPGGQQGGQNGGKSGGKSGETQGGNSNREQSPEDTIDEAISNADKITEDAKNAAKIAKESGDTEAAATAKAAAEEAEDNAEIAKKELNRAKQALNDGDGQSLEDALRKATDALNKAQKAKEEAEKAAGIDNKDKDTDKDTEPGTDKKDGEKTGDGDGDKSGEKSSKDGDGQSEKSGDNDGQNGGNSDKKNDNASKLRDLLDKLKNAGNNNANNNKNKKDGDSQNGASTNQAGGDDSSIEDYEPLLEEVKRWAEKTCEKHAKSLNPKLRTFLEKCKVSKELKSNGLMMDASKGSRAWNKKVEIICRQYVRQKLQTIKQFKRSYKKFRRGEGQFTDRDLQAGRIIFPGRKELKDKAGFDICSYIDVSGSMAHCIKHVFTANYSIIEYVIKQLGSEPMIDKMKIKPRTFVFDTKMWEVKYGESTHTYGSTYEFDKLLADIHKNGSNALINLIITDAGFQSIDNDKSADIIKEMDSLFIIVTNTNNTSTKDKLNSLEKAVQRKCGPKLHVIQTDEEFTVK